MQNGNKSFSTSWKIKSFLSVSFLLQLNLAFSKGISRIRVNFENKVTAHLLYIIQFSLIFFCIIYKSANKFQSCLVYCLGLVLGHF